MLTIQHEEIQAVVRKPTTHFLTAMEFVAVLILGCKCESLQ